MNSNNDLMEHYDMCLSQLRAIRDSLDGKYGFSDMEIVVQGEPVRVNVRLFLEHVDNQIDYYVRIKRHMSERLCGV